MDGHKISSLVPHPRLSGHVRPPWVQLKRQSRERSSAPGRMDVNVCLQPQLVERYSNAADPHDAAATLCEAGLPRDGIDNLVLSRLWPTTPAASINASRPANA